MSPIEQLAADIDATLHGGQRSFARYSKYMPLIERAFDKYKAELHDEVQAMVKGFFEHEVGDAQ